MAESDLSPPTKVTPAPPHTRQAAKADLKLFCLGLDQASTPLLLLAQDGTILHANPIAQRALTAKSVLRIKQRRLFTRRQEETDALVALIAELFLADPIQVSPSSMTLCDRAGCVIMILAFRRVTLCKTEPMLILRVADLRSWPLLDHRWLAHVFGLTEAEASVATSLFAGHDLAVTAAARRCSVETVRTLLKRAMRKLGVNRQAQMHAVLHGALAATEPSSSDQS